MIKVEISRSEREVLYGYAQQKAKLSIVDNDAGRKKYGGGDKLRNYLGYLGEFAVLRTLGMEDQFDPNLINRGDDGYDLEVQGCKIEVKTTESKGYPLWVKQSDKGVADIYVNVGIYRKVPEFLMTGWATKQEVFAVPLAWYPYRGDKPQRKVERLRPYEELLENLG